MDSDLTVQQNTYIFCFLLFLLNIMSDQKLSDNNELRPLALDGS